MSACLLYSGHQNVEGERMHGRPSQAGPPLRREAADVSRRTAWIVCGALMAIAAAFRIYLMSMVFANVDGDQAVLGIMAYHIQRGEHPVFYYGQPYTGSLEAYAAALLFSVFGANDFTVRLPALAFSVAFVGAVYWLGAVLYGLRIAVLAGLFLALGPALLIVWSTAAGVTAMPAGPAPTGIGPLGCPVAGSIRVTVPSWLLATQTASEPTAMPSGSPPTSIFLIVTTPWTGSIRSTVLSPWLATHTPLGPLAMAAGTLPTGMVWTTLPAAMLICDTVPSPLLATHTLPPVTVTAAGSVPTGIACTTAWVAGLIWDTVPSALSTAQTDPSP